MNRTKFQPAPELVPSVCLPFSPEYPCPCQRNHLTLNFSIGVKFYHTKRDPVAWRLTDTCCPGVKKKLAFCLDIFSMMRMTKNVHLCPWADQLQPVKIPLKVVAMKHVFQFVNPVTDEILMPMCEKHLNSVKDKFLVLRVHFL